MELRKHPKDSAWRFLFSAQGWGRPQGIVGCGYVVSEPYKDTHRDTEKASNGLAALRTDIEFIALSPQPLIPLSTLQQRHQEYTWTPQNGGRQIPDEISKDLLQIIQDGAAGTLELRTPEKQQQYLEGAVKTVTLKTYDRCPAARQECIDHYGYKCVVCNFDFEQAYGEIGTKYIEVHHVTQLADIRAEYEVDPIRDLRPVCGNCHAMVHRQRPPMSVDELRTRLQAQTCLTSK